MLHVQVSLAAVNQICVIHEAMNGCKNLKIYYYRISLKMLIFVFKIFVLSIFEWQLETGFTVLAQ